MAELTTTYQDCVNYLVTQSNMSQEDAQQCVDGLSHYLTPEKVLIELQKIPAHRLEYQTIVDNLTNQKAINWETLHRPADI